MILKTSCCDTSGCFHIRLPKSYNFSSGIESFVFTFQFMKCCCWNRNKAGTFFHSTAFGEQEW